MHVLSRRPLKWEWYLTYLYILTHVLCSTALCSRAAHSLSCIGERAAYVNQLPYVKVTGILLIDVDLLTLQIKQFVDFYRVLTVYHTISVIFRQIYRCQPMLCHLHRMGKRNALMVHFFHFLIHFVVVLRLDVITTSFGIFFLEMLCTDLRVIFFLQIINWYNSEWHVVDSNASVSN